MVLRTIDDGSIIAHDVVVADSSWARMRGLIGAEPVPGRALLMERARQVHTFGMRFAIDVVFCDHDWMVVDVVSGLPPWRVSRWVKGSYYIVELPASERILPLVRGCRLALTDR